MDEEVWLKRQGESIGEYVVISPIGKGGMGEIYLCRDLRLNRNVAVKLISESGMDGGIARDRLFREARLLAQAHHPNIATIFGVGEDGISPFIAMEYLQGETLHAVIQTCRLNYSEMIQVLSEIGMALQVAHDEGILHRDLKPTNILFDRYGFAKLIDFGIASGRTVLTTLDGGEQVIEGTINYMAPEMLKGAPPSVATEIYAMGLMALEMLTGEIPFFYDTQEETVQAIEQGRLGLERIDQALLPPDLIGVISKATFILPNMRFATAADFVEALRMLKLPSTSSPYARPLRKVKKVQAEGCLEVLAKSPLARPEWPLVMSRALSEWNHSENSFSTTIMEEFVPFEVVQESVDSVLHQKAEQRRRTKSSATKKYSSIEKESRRAKEGFSQLSSISMRKKNKGERHMPQVEVKKSSWPTVVALAIGLVFGALVHKLIADERIQEKLRQPASFFESIKNQK